MSHILWLECTASNDTVLAHPVWKREIFSSFLFIAVHGWSRKGGRGVPVFWRSLLINYSLHAQNILLSWVKVWQKSQKLFFQWAVHKERARSLFCLRQSQTGCLATSFVDNVVQILSFWCIMEFAIRVLIVVHSICFARVAFPCQLDFWMSYRDRNLFC